jgi:hypothetical protein
MKIRSLNLQVPQEPSQACSGKTSPLHVKQFKYPLHPLETSFQHFQAFLTRLQNFEKQLFILLNVYRASS